MGDFSNLFLEGFLFGVGLSAFAMGLMVVWSAFVKTSNSL